MESIAKTQTVAARTTPSPGSCIPVSRQTVQGLPLERTPPHPVPPSLGHGTLPRGCAHKNRVFYRWVVPGNKATSSQVVGRSGRWMSPASPPWSDPARIGRCAHTLRLRQTECQAKLVAQGLYFQGLHTQQQRAERDGENRKNRTGIRELRGGGSINREITECRQAQVDTQGSKVPGDGSLDFRPLTVGNVPLVRRDRRLPIPKLLPGRFYS